VNPFEYLLVLAAVILGLAVSDLAMSANRLLDAGERIKWDWLAPLAAIVVFLKIVTQWWTWFSAAPIAKGLTFEMYLGVLSSAVLLFLLAAASLPDQIGDGKFDLAEYYRRVQRRYWLIFAAHFAVSAVVNAWVQIALEAARFAFSLAYLIVPGAIALGFIRVRWLHAVALLALIGVYLAQLFGHGLGQ